MQSGPVHDMHCGQLFVHYILCCEMFAAQQVMSAADAWLVYVY